MNLSENKAEASHESSSAVASAFPQESSTSACWLQTHQKDPTVTLTETLCALPSSLERLKAVSQGGSSPNKHIEDHITDHTEAPPCLLYCASCAQDLEATLTELLQDTKSELGKLQDCATRALQVSPPELSVNGTASAALQLYSSDRRNKSSRSTIQLHPEKPGVLSPVDDLNELTKEVALLKQRYVELRREQKEKDTAIINFQSRLRRKQALWAALEAQAHYNSAALSQLLRVNVMHDTFNIGTDGCYATINGLKLGKRPDDNVSWDEVNAAFGQAGFLLDCLVQATLKIYNSQLSSNTQRVVVRTEQSNSVDGQVPRAAEVLQQPCEAKTEEPHPDVTTADHSPPNGDPSKDDDTVAPTRRHSDAVPSCGASSKTAETAAVRVSSHFNHAVMKQQGENTVKQQTYVPPPKLLALRDYRVVPRGNYSAILCRNDGSLLELYYTGGGLTRYFSSRRFDQAITVTLSLIKDLIALADYMRTRMAGSSAVRLAPPFEYGKDNTSRDSALATWCCPFGLPQNHRDNRGRGERTFIGRLWKRRVDKCIEKLIDEFEMAHKCY